jgi:hypothetical protein
MVGSSSARSRTAPARDTAARTVAAECHRRPPCLVVVGTRQVHGHLAGPDTVGLLAPAEDTDDHEHALGDERERHGVGGVEAVDHAALAEHSAQHVRQDDPEDRW